MTSNAKTPEEYLKNVPEERKEAFLKLRNTIVDNLPEGFSEQMSYGMIGYVVPKSLFPDGYHCDPKLPLPFMSIASQKNFIAVYHMGIYAKKELHDWFMEEYPKHVKTKLNMGKSCLRFKNPEKIPFKLIGELSSKMTPEAWIECYEKKIRK